MNEKGENRYIKDGKRDWETEVRDAFRESLNDPDPVVRALADEVLKMDRLNEFCFVISPKIAKRLLESGNPALRDISYRLWSSQEEGHVCILAIDRNRQKIFVVEAAGLLSNGEENDSSLGIHELNAQGVYKLFGNPHREQFVSPEYTDTNQVAHDPQTEEEMNSQKMQSLSVLLNP